MCMLFKAGMYIFYIPEAMGIVQVLYERKNVREVVWMILNEEPIMGLKKMVY